VESDGEWSFCAVFCRVLCVWRKV